MKDVNKLEPSEMTTRLSSPFTFLFKIVFPCLWLGFGLFLIVRTLLEFREVWTLGAACFWVLWLGISIGVFYWKHFPVKQVILEDQCLCVSNYLKQITIPLALAESVKVTGLFGWWSIRVIVTLKTNSEFGSKIQFIPGFYYKEVVELLRRNI